LLAGRLGQARRVASARGAFDAVGFAVGLGGTGDRAGLVALGGGPGAGFWLAAWRV
jgi:hypothetical protein